MLYLQKPTHIDMKTTDEKKIYKHLNWITIAVVTIVFIIEFCYGYFVRGYPIERTWGVEFLKFLVLWVLFSAFVLAAGWIPLQALAEKIANKRKSKEQ
jgi:heme/copper-type cytochrome/quinol oxidase subunit 2